MPRKIKSYFTLLSILFCTELFAQYITNRTDSLNGNKENAYVLGNSVVTNFWDHPAYAGSEERHNLNITYTRLLLGISHSPREFNFAYDGALGKRKNFGFGSYFAFGRYGKLSAQRIDLCTSIKIKLYRQSTLRLGFSLSPFTRYKMPFGIPFVFGDQIDPRYGFIYESSENVISNYYMVVLLDGSVGAWVSNPHFYLGASLLHLFQVRTIIDNYMVLLQRSLGLTLNLIGGYHFKLFKNLSISPSLSLYTILKNNLYHDLSVLLIYKRNYLFGISSDINFNSFTLKAGGILLNHIRLLVSLRYYTNDNLHEILGPSFISGNIRGQL